MEVIKHKEKIMIGYFGPIEILYTPRASIFTSTDVTTNFVKFVVKISDSIGLPTLGGT